MLVLKNKEVATQLDISIITNITSILTRYFPNGFRTGSDIEIERYKKNYRVRYGTDLPITDADLKKALEGICIRHSGKLFILTPYSKKILNKMLRASFSSGAILIYYDAFYEINEPRLTEMLIYSPEMLVKFLKSLFPQLYFSRSYFSEEQGGTPKDEILKCFTDGAVLSYNQISTRLPYMPLSKIKQLLVQNNDFIWVSSEHYTHMSKIDITVKDWRNIERFLLSELKHRDFVSASELNIAEIKERNPQLSVVAIRDAIYHKFMTNSYEMRGNIITKCEPLTLREIIVKYCLDRNSVTYQEIVDFESSLNEYSHNICLDVAYQVMVRVSHDLFVADNNIDFNVNQIDATLEMFCPGDYVPLQSITDFSQFPYSGYSWNVFLLESYLRRFSNSFRWDAQVVNSRCVGAIIRRSSAFHDYGNVLVDAVARANVPLDEESIADFLYNSGFLGRRSLSRAKCIAVNARKMRGGGL